MKFLRKFFLILALVSAIGIGAVGCNNDSAIEDAGEKAEEAMEEAGEDLGESLDDVGDKVD